MNKRLGKYLPVLQILLCFRIVVQNLAIPLPMAKNASTNTLEMRLQSIWFIESIYVCVTGRNIRIEPIADLLGEWQKFAQG